MIMVFILILISMLNSVIKVLLDQIKVLYQRLLEKLVLTNHLRDADFLTA